MKPNLFIFGVFLLLVHFTGAKPFTDQQSLDLRLDNDNEIAPYYSMEDIEVEGKDGSTDKSVFAVPPQQSLESSDSSNSALAAKENVFVRIFKDLLRTSKRSWSRYKKGGLRSCFGVRLERIGSFSGLGC